VNKKLGKTNSKRIVVNYFFLIKRSPKTSGQIATMKPS